MIGPSLIAYQPQHSIARRFWPWAAFAVSQFGYEQRQSKKAPVEPKPGEVLELLETIERACGDLVSSLNRLQELSYGYHKAEDRLRSGHIEWLDQFMSQATAGMIAAEVQADGDTLLRVLDGKLSFLNRVITVQAAANVARSRADVTLLKQKAGPRQMPGLRRLVFRTSKIWIAMTGRPPSANRVHRRINQDDKGPEPDYVRFVQALAGVTRGAVAPPSRKMVEVALANLASQNTARKS